MLAIDRANWDFGRTRTPQAYAGRRRVSKSVEAVYAAGLDPALWPKALDATARLLGARAATVESYSLPDGRLLDLHAVGIPPAEQLDYFEHYAAINPRALYAMHRPAQKLVWDYHVLDERQMDRDAYYSEFLPRTDFRYFLAGTLARTENEVSIVTIQRTRREGHVAAAEIKLMTQLVPHYRQALDLAARLKRSTSARSSLEGALDWLADGVALLGHDGALLYANVSLQDMARRKDGIAIKKSGFAFASAEARSRFANALAAIGRLREGDATTASLHDFSVPRDANAPSYLFSLRPLTRTQREIDTDAAAIVFVRDPLRRDPTGGNILVELFRFTPAEASLAQAIQTGVPLAEYARQRDVSLNTVYTHLRRIKEKTGCKRMAELIRKLNDLQVPLRLD